MKIQREVWTVDAGRVVLEVWCTLGDEHVYQVSPDLCPEQAERFERCARALLGVETVAVTYVQLPGGIRAQVYEPVVGPWAEGG